MLVPFAGRYFSARAQKQDKKFQTLPQRVLNVRRVLGVGA